MAKLSELLKNVPKAVGDTAKDRAKSLGKSIVRNVHPKNLLAKGFYALHSAASAELPELGGILGGVGAFAGDVYDRASGKRNKKFGQYQPQPQAAPQQRSNDNTGGMEQSSVMIKLLQSINSSIALLCDDSKSILSELKTLTSITSKVWDVSKKTLAVTRQGNDIQVDLDRKKRFTTQEAAGDFKGESKFSATAPEPKKKEPFSFEVTESMFHAAEGLLAEAGEISAGILGIKLASKAIPKFKKLPAGTRATFGEPEGAKPGSPLATKVAQAGKTGKYVDEMGTTIKGAEAAGAVEAGGASLLKIIGTKSLWGLVGMIVVNGLKKSWDAGGIKAIGENIEENGIIGGLFKSVFSVGKDSIWGVIVNIISEVIPTAEDVVAWLWGAFKGIIKGLVVGSAKGLFGKVYASKIADGLETLLSIGDKVGAAATQGANAIQDVDTWGQKAANWFEGVTDEDIAKIKKTRPITPVSSMPSNFVPQSETTRQAASIHSNQQMVDQAQTTSQMGAMKPAASGTNVISSTQNNVNNTANSFAVSGPGKRGGELEEHIYPNISQ